MSDKKATVFARVLDSKEWERITPSINKLWYRTNEVYRRYGFSPDVLLGKQGIPNAGRGLVQWPFQAPYDMSWGLVAPTDMPKWRWAYRARTEARRGIDVKVTYALGRGCTFIIKGKPEWEDYANHIYNSLHLKERSITLTNNALVYGQGYAEKVRDQPSNIMETERQISHPMTVGSSVDVDNAMLAAHQSLNPQKFWSRRQFYSPALFKAIDDISQQYNAMTMEWDRIAREADQEYGHTKATPARTKTFNIAQKFTTASEKPIRSKISVPTEAIARPNFQFTANAAKGNTVVGKPSKKINPQGELVSLKVLDPLYVWIQRHPMDIVIGFNQWGIGGIPQTFMPEEMVYVKWMTNSWVYESAYGTSVLMSATPHISRLVQFEEDVTLWHHLYSKPPPVLYGGTEERPYGTQKLANYQNIMSNLAPNAGLVLPRDTELVYPLPNFNPGQTSEFLINYWRERIYEAIGIPSILMNMSQTGDNRSIGDVAMQGFIQDEVEIQQLSGEWMLEQIIIPELLLKFGGEMDEELPDIEAIWPPILIDDRNKTFDRLAKAVGGPWITKNEARKESGYDPLAKGDVGYDKSLDEIQDQAEMGMQVAGGGFGQKSKPEESETGRSGPRQESKQKRDRDNPSAD